LVVVEPRASANRACPGVLRPNQTSGPFRVILWGGRGSFKIAWTRVGAVA
jgi:hypothetical protein